MDCAKADWPQHKQCCKSLAKVAFDALAREYGGSIEHLFTKVEEDFVARKEGREPVLTPQQIHTLASLTSNLKDRSDVMYEAYMAASVAEAGLSIYTIEGDERARESALDKLAGIFDTMRPSAIVSGYFTVDAIAYGDMLCYINQPEKAFLFFQKMLPKIEERASPEA